MDRQQKIDIANRLDCYLGYTPEQSLAIIKQVMYALDIEDGTDTIITTQREMEDDNDFAYTLGSRDSRRVGYMQAIEDMLENRLICEDGIVRAELSKLQSDYLDTH